MTGLQGPWEGFDKGIEGTKLKCFKISAMD